MVSLTIAQASASLANEKSPSNSSNEVLKLVKDGGVFLIISYPPRRPSGKPLQDEGKLVEAIPGYMPISAEHEWWKLTGQRIELAALR